MNRIKIDLPDKWLFTANVSVRITDINYGNHAGNDAIVGLIHEARMMWLHTYGCTELDIEGTGIIMSGLMIEFKNEAYYGDLMEIKIFCGNTTPKSFELYYSVSTNRNAAMFLIAKAKSEMISFDYAEKKIINMPLKLKEILSSGL
jgi:acyl-CoA thioesterase FadM